MKNILYIWKPVGFTPLEIVEKFKERNPEYKNEIISYAGRLDPMAEGILILLIDEENKKRNNYLGLEKEYESEIVFGISTDTFDSLGLITNNEFKDLSKNEIENCLSSFLGKQKQAYPPYSSKAVKGKPLYWWARKGKINEIKIPETEIQIYSIELLVFENISVNNLVNVIIDKIEKINGDFRQKEIINTWQKFENENSNENLIKIKIKVNCSSGTYIRRIADDLGKKLESNAFALSIKRTKIGEISEKDCLRI